MKPTKSQIYMIIGAIAVIMIIAIIAAAVVLKTPKPAPITNANLNANTAPEIVVPTTTPTTTPPKTTAPPSAKTKAKSSLTYEQAAKTYGGRIFQFNGNCQAQPSSMVIKNKTTIMLDNRSAGSRIITIGSKKYSVAPYNFTLVAVTAVTALPATISLACNSQYNVARILIQQ